MRTKSARYGRERRCHFTNYATHYKLLNGLAVMADDRHYTLTEKPPAIISFCLKSTFRTLHLDFPSHK